MSHTDSEDRDAERWRRKLLPLMTRMLVGLAIFFFAISFVQISYLHWRIERSPAADFSGPNDILTTVASRDPQNATYAANMMILAKLEANAMERRYHQASVVLMARVWTSYLGFMTGMILALVGAAFTLGRVQGTPTDLGTKVGDTAVTLKTSTAGIVLATLGVVLMVVTLFVRYDITVKDAAVYAGPVEKSGEVVNKQEPPPVAWPSTAEPVVTPRKQ